MLLASFFGRKGAYEAGQARRAHESIVLVRNTDCVGRDGSPFMEGGGYAGHRSAPNRPVMSA